MKTIYTVITLNNKGLVEQCSSYEVRKDAEKVLVEYAKTDGVNISTYNELMALQEESNLNKEYFIQENVFTPMNKDSYPYQYKGEYMSLYELQAKLAEEGYPFAEECDELEFSDYINDIQNCINFNDGLPMPEPIEGLLQRYYLTYRRGEINKVVYAMNESEAINKACEEEHHPEYWEVDEEM